MKLLVVEDEFDLNRTLTKLLKKQQYSVDSAFDGEEALDFLAVGEYDAVILDVMMPKLDGYGVIKQLRQQQNPVPVLMLTARDALSDKVQGLDAGADDYMIKPFEFDELLARVRAMLRRQHRDVLESRIVIKAIELDTAAQTVYKQGERIELTAKEYALLEYLMRHQNKIISRDQIREHVWDFDYEGESNIIEVIVKNIRRKLDDAGATSFIQTKRGAGYVIWSE